MSTYTYLDKIQGKRQGRAPVSACPYWDREGCRLDGILCVRMSICGNVLNALEKKAKS